MKSFKSFLIFLAFNLSIYAQDGIIINHNHTDLSKIPDEWIQSAKHNLKIRYFRRSHGSQLDLGGMAALRRYSSVYNSKYAYNLTGANNELLLSVQPTTSWNSLDFENTTWVQITRTYLDNPVNAQINVVIWAWSSSFYLCDPYKYIADMETLISEYGPNGSKILSGTRNVPVTFVFQTACGSRSVDRNPLIYAGNKIIRNHCVQNNRILFDFNDLECYNPDGAYFGDGDPSGNYTSARRLNDDLAYLSSTPGGSVYAGCRNWGIDWNTANPNSELAKLSADNICTSCSHSQGTHENETKDNSRLHCVLKGRAAWWLYARLAGWKDKILTISSALELSESNLNDAVINLSLTDETFSDAVLLPSNFQLIGAPPGTAIESVTYNNNQNAAIALSFDGTDFDINYEQFGIRILASELTKGGNLSGNSLNIQAIIENNPILQSTWTGLVSSDWNNSDNWTTGVPNAAINAIIPSGPANQPVINSDVETNQLTVEEVSGLTVNPLKSLTVNGKFYINGNFTLKSDENGNACLINKDIISYGRLSDIKTELYLSGNRFHYVSSPTISTHTDRFKVDPVFSGQNPNFYFWDETNATSLIANGWRYVDGFMDVMKGYAAYYENSEIITLERINSGDFNTGDKSTDLTYTGINNVLPVINRGWNLAGNPFPAYLDWNSPAWTKTNIYNSIYYWNGTNYSYYVSGGGAYDNGIGVNNGSNIIPPMQGFFVKVIGNDNLNHIGTLVAPESARTTVTHHFYKNKSADESGILRLKITGNANTDETVIRILAGATIDFDNNYDAFKLFVDNSSAVPQIYSLGPDKTPYAINTLPDYYDKLVIPLGFKSSVPARYTICSNQVRLKDDLRLWLVDILEKKVVRINTLNYSFYANAGHYEDRFRIVCSIVRPDFLNEQILMPEIEISSFQNEIFIKSDKTDATIGEVKIINLFGQTVYHSENTTGGMLRIILNDYIPGIYIVKMINKYGIKTEKVLLMEN